MPAAASSWSESTAGLNFTTIIVAIIGAIVTIAIYRLVTGQRVRT